VTSDIVRRVSEHKQHLKSGFAAQHDVKKLVYYEMHGEIVEAIRREKQIKKWERSWKIRLIEEQNPDWKDLFDVIAS